MDLAQTQQRLDQAAAHANLNAKDLEQIRQYLHQQKLANPQGESNLALLIQLMQQEMLAQQRTESEGTSEGEYVEEDAEMTLEELQMQLNGQSIDMQKLVLAAASGFNSEDLEKHLLALHQFNSSASIDKQRMLDHLKSHSRRDAPEDSQEYMSYSQESAYEEEPQTTDVQEDSLSFSQEQETGPIQAVLSPPQALSANFKRFYAEFESYIDFILRWDYEILPQLQVEQVSKHELARLKTKYDNLLTQSREMCRRFTGPHCVLQVFLEKIIASIGQIADTLKEYT